MTTWLCRADTVDELDAKIREIAALENVGRGDEIHGTLAVEYSDESVKNASLIPWLENRGVLITWKKVAGL